MGAPLVNGKNVLLDGPARPRDDLQDPEFTVNFGDYLLHLGHDPAAWISSFRNMAGREGLVPVRMIQDIHLP